MARDSSFYHVRFLPPVLNKSLVYARQLANEIVANVLSDEQERTAACNALNNDSFYCLECALSHDFVIKIEPGKYFARARPALLQAHKSGFVEEKATWREILFTQVYQNFVQNLIRRRVFHILFSMAAAASGFSSTKRLQIYSTLLDP